jgi:hypothetical protein
MIINGKSVRGIYQYNENSDYEKGDFVVDGECIFICTANSPTDTTNYTVRGQKPILNGKFNSENYKAYPGDLISNADEYYEIIKNNGNNTEDKYVSSYALSEILKRSYFGVNEIGVITDHVFFSAEDNTIDYSVGSKSITDYVDTTTDVLTKILLEPELNNGMVLVSRDLPEIKNLFLEAEESDSNINESYYEGKNNIVLLKQYTYIENKIKWRVQELIDTKYGESYYRYLKSLVVEGETDAIKNELKKYVLEGGYVSTWRSNFGGNSKNGKKQLINKINTIQNAFTERLNDYESKLLNLEGSFKFREAENENTDQNSFGVKLGHGDTGLSSGDLVTITCICRISTNANVNVGYSITIPLIDTEEPVYYYLGNYKETDYYIYQHYQDGKDIFIIVNSVGETDIVSGCSVKNLYYRYKYSPEN